MFVEVNNESKKSYRGFSIAAMVLGIVSIVTAATVWLGIACGVVAIVFAILTLKKSGGQNKNKAIAGLVTGIIGIVFSAFMLFIYILAVQEVEKEFYDSLNQLEYEYNTSLEDLNLEDLEDLNLEDLNLEDLNLEDLNLEDLENIDTDALEQELNLLLEDLENV